MKSKIKNRLIFFGVIVLLLGAFSFWYKTTYSMEEIVGYSLNSDALSKKIAIATQGSPFKNALVTNIVNHYKKDSVFINVDDISKLPTLSVQEYDVIIIIHTWEYGNPPEVVSQFINKNISTKEKLLVVATSGQGTHKIEGVDALAGESILENASDLSNTIIEKIEMLLQ